MAPLLRLEHVGCAYGTTTVLDDVTIELADGEFVGLVGPSGGGKTTVLRAMLGTVPPSYGTVHRRPGVRVGYVPQLEAVDWTFPVTVREVVTMAQPRPRRPRWRSEPSPATVELLSRLGIADLAERHIRELSGGQQQRVFLARALTADPDLLVLDEPAAGVDVAARHEMLHLLADLHRAGTTIVLTTHDVNGLAAHLPRIVCFRRTVIADGPPAEVLHPYVLERTYGAPMEVLQHGGMPVVLEPRGHGPHVARRAGSA